MWTHKKFGKKEFVGRYVRDARGERTFELYHYSKTNSRFITFESWQAAKAAGWKKA